MTDTQQSPRRRPGEILNDLATGQPAHVSIKDNKFTLVDTAGQKQPIETYDSKTGLYMDCVIVDTLEVRSRTFWGEGQKYDPANIKRPVCFSNNGVAPSANANQPQARTCADCKWSEWGTATSFKGKPVPACSQLQHIAVLMPEMNMVFLLRVPPVNLKVIDNYNTSFRSQDFMIDDVITRIDFAGVGTLRFRPMRRLTQQETEQREIIFNSGVTDNLLGRGDRPYQGLITQQQPPFEISPPPSQPSQTPSQPSQPATTQTAKRGPGRPRRVEAPQEEPKGNGGEQPMQFGIQEPTQPDPGVAQAVNDFFGQKG